MIDIIVGLLVVIIIGAALFYIRKEKKKGACVGCPYSTRCQSITPVILTTAVTVIQKNKYRILSPPLAGISCEGHFIYPFCRKGASCPRCNSLSDRRSRRNPTSQSSKPKSLSDSRREAE